MIHSDQIYLETEGRERAPRPAAGTAGAAEQVGDKRNASF
jgi:hypothetical protein